MSSNFPLISVLVLCYNNQKYIYENLASIFDQTYPSIEVLIADDASEHFNAEELINWINKNKKENIIKIAIFENKFNLGTVANLERLHKKAQGEFLFNIAADDVLYDSNVLMSMYKKAREVGSEAQIIVSETEMWDEKLEYKIGDFLKADGIKKIKDSTALELFAECSWHAFLPACYLYRRTLLAVVGELSNKYSLVEDWPTQIIACREGIKPIYCDIKSSIKHRDGGISHGNTLNAHMASLKYFHDFYQVYANEIEPFLNKLTLEESQRARGYATDRFRAYYKIHLPRLIELVNREKETNKNISIIQEPIIGQEYLKTGRLRNLALKLSSKRVILVNFLILVVLCFLIIFAYSNNSTIVLMLVVSMFGFLTCCIIGLIILNLFWRNKQ